MKAIDVTIVGGGMITHDLLLPSIYHLQRTGVVAEIAVCALNSPPLCALRDSKDLQGAFPGQSFTPHPAFDTDPGTMFPDLYKQVLAGMKPRQAVVVAMPDPLHYPVIMEAFKHNQHVLCVKPLVLEYKHALEIERIGKEKGLFVGVEYHKRFDTRALMAKRHYEQGHFGQFIMGEAKMIEPYYYRHSNFQNWFTCDQTDPFVYVGCHYVDLVCFITGLKPAAVSVNGIKGRFPNGNEGYLWANGRVIFENGAILSVTDGLGYPDDGAGSNEQCLSMFFEGDGKTGCLKHDDQFRGVSHSYLEGIGCAGSTFNFVSPDFYQLVPWEGPGYKPVGYGFLSVAATIETIRRIENETDGLPESDAIARRRAIIREVDEKGIIATPANSSVNELVMEAARLSILNDGAMVDITHGHQPRVALRAR
ncbi:MAG TPA: Gfo/Idh/MocA family oxidoreductase [Candidatus Hydrogenedentes bacterium]|nr:Gfo/Idh/MocA family oxidoreductase [Candidatus Hydrogenedentota bacterium]HOV73156.1 Gfo/Idh/MocA family oxidoreductase [Candidatus Hydrogenedentota bacterium]HPC16812.1 Gfo/Idh/MocA family oxidoreductase [Candidatus Hydrogenedentota bacterium]HRT18531.1 Gfo/Idh/MocA family oxidoreductase [Candidatus Hydrogenedentota bacterium]HRT63550.1 Gfo/Idh/MocA family oxidoreductase [Candidatus Hydrogenedentota bacterium]